ncbi:MAG: molybdenum cofactor biosynthesis protein MoaE [bacterium]
MVEIIWEPIEPSSVNKKIKQQECGYLVIHYGLVRRDVSNEGKTFYIEFEPTQYTIGELETIATDIKNKWSIEDILIVRRMGKVNIGTVHFQTISYD